MVPSVSAVRHVNKLKDITLLGGTTLNYRGTHLSQHDTRQLESKPRGFNPVMNQILMESWSLVTFKIINYLS